MIKRMLLSMGIAGVCLAACAEMVHEGPDAYNEYRNRDGVVTRFWNDGMCIGVLTNWFGSWSALVSGDTILQYLYDNQVTYDDASGAWFREESDGKWITETTGYVPAGVLWGHTFHMWAYWQKDYELAFAGYRTKDSDEILHRYDRPTNTISDVYAVWKSVPRWHNGRETLNIQQNSSYLTDYFWRLTPERKEDSWTCWSTDVPVINAVFYVQFPAWIEWVMNGDTEIAIEHHPVDSVDCEVTLVICSTSAENDWLGKTIPLPGTEYYKKIKTRATARYQGMDLYQAWSRMEVSCSPGECLPEGTYRFWIEVNSDRSIAESAYDDNGYSGVFTVSDDSLNVDVAPFACDWVKGELMLHWRIADSEGMSDEESNSMINLKNKRFNVWRSVGKGWDDFSNAELVGHSVSGAYWTDNNFGKIPGVEPVKYWVQILTGKETDTRARPTSPPYASCVTRRRFGLAIGVGEFSKLGTTIFETEICQPVNDIALFKELFYREYGECQGDYRELLNEKADLESVRKSFAAVRTNADGSAHAKPGDILLLYMAMHGEQTRLALFDRYYSVDELHDDLTALDENSGIKVIAMLMACHSGALTEATAAHDDTITIENKFRNIAWIASCRGEQKSTAIEDDTISLFGRCFLGFGWKHGNGDTASIVNKSGWPFGRVLPDGKPDGVLTFLELAQYARNLAVGCSSKYKSLVTTTGDDLLRATDVLEECMPSAPVVPSAPIQFEGACINGAVALKWSSDPNASFYSVYYRKMGSAKWEHYRLVDPAHPIVESGNDGFVISVFENTHDALNHIQRFFNCISQKVQNWYSAFNVPFDPGEKYRYVILDYGETYEFKVAGVNASGVGPCSYIIQGAVRDYKDEVMFNRVLEYSGNMQINSGESDGTLDVRVAVKDGYTGTSSQSSDGVPVEIVATYKRNGEDSIYIGEATICSNEICTVALDGQGGTLNLEMSSMGILATFGEATAACLRTDDSGTFEIDSESLKQKSAFVESDVSAREGTNVTVVVVSGDEGNASNVKLHLMYNTAAAADLDLAKGAVDGVTPKGGLKFPLTLTWKKGEIGEKVISIPIKKDTLVEGNEFFTLKLADAQGMALGDERVCTVTIEDVDSSVQTINEVVISQGISIAKEGSDAWFVVDSEPGNLNLGRSVKLRSPLLSANDGSVSLFLNGFKGQGLLRVAYRFVGVTGAEEPDECATFCITDGKDVVYEGGNCSVVDGWNVADVLLTGNGMHTIKMRFFSRSDKKVGLEICAIRWALRDQTGRYQIEHYIDRECSPISAGTIQGGGYYLNGAKATLIATAKPGWVFVEWRNAKTGGMATKNTKLSITVEDDAEYVAVFEKIPYIRGLADPADGGKVSGSGLCAAGKKVTLKASANKNFVFVGWCQGTGNGERGTGMPGFDERLQKGAVEYVATTPSLVIDRSAKPGKDSATSTTITNVNEDATFYACFITSAEDKAAVAAAVDGLTLDPWVSKTETHAFTTNIWAGVYLEWPVAASALSEAKVKVAGLPAGLKFTDKPVTSKIGTGRNSVTVTNVLANTIYGAPTAASKIDKNGVVNPSEVKVTVTTAGKSSQTYQIDAVVDALPAWAQGAFSGGVLGQGTGNGEQGTVEVAGQVSLTIDAKGKVSGKALGGGLTYTLAAPYYAGFEAVDDGEGVYSNFIADVTTSWSYKEGSKAIKTNDVVHLTVQDNGIGGVATGTFDPLHTLNPIPHTPDPKPYLSAWQYNWKADPWKDVGKKFDKQTQTYAILSDGSFSDNEEVLASALGADVTGRVTLKFAASGTVSVSGEFVSGAYNDKTKKYPTVKATGSATLVPVDDEHGEVFIYLTPKGLPPHARCLSVAW